MNKSAEKIYSASPVIIQNIFTTLYGVKLHLLRYGIFSNRNFTELCASEKLSQEKMSLFAGKKLKRIVKIASEYVPYYKEMLNREKINPDSISSLSDIEKIPFLSKEIVRKSPELFVDERFNLKSLVKRFTSGTSGKPLTVYCRSDDLRRNYSFFLRTRSWCGIRMGDRRATFYGRVIIPQQQEKKPFWRYDASENNLLFSSYNMNDESLASYCGKLCSFKPAEVRGYPSSLYTIAGYMIKKGYPHFNPKGIFTTAETLFDYQRQVIETAFGCRVYDQYGSTEMANFVTQCEYGTYHSHPEYGVIEILKQGKKVLPGEEGEVVCTGFVNETMPLLRYKLGDSAVASDIKCRCGRNFPVIEKILGRCDDLIKTSDGRQVGRLDPVFKGINGIRECQIIQERNDLIVLNVIADEKFDDKEKEKLGKQIAERVGELMNIEIKNVDDIPRDARGKFRAVISRINSSSVKNS